MNLISFEPEQMERVLKLLGVDITQEFVGKCNSCGMKLTLDNVGTVANGKNEMILYCDDADCFARQLTHDYLKSSDVVEKEGEQ